MIAKELRPIATKSLRQEQSLRDHNDAVEVVHVLNPKFQDLIPGRLGPAGAPQQAAGRIHRVSGGMEQVSAEVGHRAGVVKNNSDYSI
jgi:hypothetical protein